jgi:hypothetical protein
LSRQRNSAAAAEIQQSIERPNKMRSKREKVLQKPIPLARCATSQRFIWLLSPYQDSEARFVFLAKNDQGYLY